MLFSLFFVYSTCVCSIFSLLPAVADADVITALTTLGILERTSTAAETTTDGGGPQSGGASAEPAAAAHKSDEGVAGPAFKPKDTAALRAVAVQVRKLHM